MHAFLKDVIRDLPVSKEIQKDVEEFQGQSRFMESFDRCLDLSNEGDVRHLISPSKNYTIIASKLFDLDHAGMLLTIFNHVGDLLKDASPVDIEDDDLIIGMTFSIDFVDSFACSQSLPPLLNARKLQRKKAYTYSKDFADIKSLLSGTPIARSSSFTVAGSLSLSDEGNLQLLTMDGVWLLSIDDIANTMDLNFLSRLVKSNAIRNSVKEKWVRSKVHMYCFRLIMEGGVTLGFILDGVKDPGPSGDVNPYSTIANVDDDVMRRNARILIDAKEKIKSEKDKEFQLEFEKRKGGRSGKNGLTNEELFIVKARLEAGNLVKPYSLNCKGGYTDGIQTVFHESLIDIKAMSARVQKGILKEQEAFQALTRASSSRNAIIQAVPERKDPPQHKHITSIDELIAAQTLAKRVGQFFLSSCNVLEHILQQNVGFLERLADGQHHRTLTASASKVTDSHHNVSTL